MDMKAHLIQPPLAQREMFMYLHKKHKALVNKAAQALSSMKRDGSYQRIFDQTLGIYGKNGS